MHVELFKVFIPMYEPYELAKEFVKKVEENIVNIEVDVSTEGGQIDELFESLKSISYLERAHAARSLGELGVRRAIPLLLTMLDDSRDYVRLQVVSALGMLMAREAIPKLGDMLVRETNEDVKIEIILALKSVGGDKVDNILKQVSDLPNMPQFLKGIPKL